MDVVPNLDYICQLSQGDKSFIHEILQVIKKELPLEIWTYNLHLAEEDFVMAAEDVHKLKHKISILGMEKGYHLAVDHEENLIKGNVSLKLDFDEILELMLCFIEKT
ncbi:hypothetical protein SAMN04487911_1536 [Arenibacter nanhaiticus]|uniref:HPt domain-containing protein n=1 Tax=Arenibacter nanhaiticus TaxID=558155 RepID=A0A1M6N1S7_9FLAO|nr:hypothetical protein [Arenibacter nanhaiticus]SHJ89641.1 hypothetical protein SAMN04487911_1536 [Arenibacter nanhaiticus]